jgi:hypothetical protein
MRILPHQGAKHCAIDHGDASDGVFILLQGCRGRTSTSSYTCGCLIGLDWSFPRMIFLLSNLYLLWMTSWANGSLCECWCPQLFSVVSSSRSRNGGRTDAGMARAADPSPLWPGSVAPSSTWVLLTFCTWTLLIASFWRCHPHIKDRGSSRMKSGPSPLILRDAPL